MEQIQANPKSQVGKAVTSQDNVQPGNNCQREHRGGSVHCVGFTYPRIGLPKVEFHSRFDQRRDQGRRDH